MPVRVRAKTLGQLIRRPEHDMHIEPASWPYPLPSLACLSRSSININVTWPRHGLRLGKAGQVN